MQHLKEENGENFSHFLDIHSTQQRKNYFMHGPQYDKDNFRYYIARFFPKLLSKHTQYFRYKSCTFKELSKNKNTSFQFVKNTFRVFNSYSVEASAGFYRNQEGEIAELGVADWEAMGRELLDALLDYTETMDIYEKLTENKRRQQGSPLLNPASPLICVRVLTLTRAPALTHAPALARARRGL